MTDSPELPGFLLPASQARRWHRERSRAFKAGPREESAYVVGELLGSIVVTGSSRPIDFNR